MPDKEDKQFDPTPRRLNKAREEGNVFQSKDLTSVGMLIVSAGMLTWLIPAAHSQMSVLTRQLFQNALSGELNTEAVRNVMSTIGWQLSILLGPFFLVLFVSAVALSIGQSGWNISAKPLTPKFERINPLQGFKRLFSAKGLFDTGKSILKVAVVGPIAYYVLTGHLKEIMMLHTIPLPTILDASTGWVMALLGWMIIALFFLAVIDFAFEKWKYKKDLKMTKREVEDERKDQEGDPHMKSKQRDLARSMRDRPRLDHAVLNADVVVTNPTHYAIALSYDPDVSGAPQVLAKGIRKRALRIKELAKEEGVPTVEDRPLAHALYDNVPEEEEIPEELYPAVAAILAQIYQEQQGSYN